MSCWEFGGSRFRSRRRGLSSQIRLLGGIGNIRLGLELWNCSCFTLSLEDTGLNPRLHSLLLDDTPQIEYQDGGQVGPRLWGIGCDIYTGSMDYLGCMKAIYSSN